MKRRLLTLALAVVLGASLCAPALAAQTQADARLAAVTQAVKEKLALDTAAYDRFSGNLNEGVVLPTWELEWTGEEGDSLSVSVSERDGRILSYARYIRSDTPVYEPVPRRGTFSPAFPSLSRSQARETARAFLARVLEEGESVQLEEDGTETLSATSYRFSGTVLVNGLPSPFRFSVQVSAADNAVTRYYFSGTDYGSVLGAFPAAVPALSAAQAGALLRGTFSMRLEYVLSEDESEAVLRYLPNGVDEYYVDARTGELVDLTQLYQTARGGGAPTPSPEAAADSMLAGSKNELTPAELEGVAQMEGVLSKEELDREIRKLTALGLEAYTLSAVSYRVDPDSGEVTARAQYTRQSGEQVWRRSVTVDGKTAALEGVSSSFPWRYEVAEPIPAQTAQRRAESFLRGQCPRELEKSELYNADTALAEDFSGSSRGFTYAQKEQGYFFPANTLQVGVDLADGSICSYSRSFEYAVPFRSPEGIVDLDAALDAWLSTYEVKLQYLAVPQALDPTEPELKVLMDRGVKYLYTLKLAYALEREGWASGVDAHSGRAVLSPTAAAARVSYDDLAGHWVEEMARTLARFNVGWAGGHMDPDKPLTQRDMVALLVSADGWLWDGETDSADDLYRRAYSMGILTEDRRADDRVLDRCELVKLLLDCAGYGDVAGLRGIFRCGFTDGEEIPEEYLGYAALSQALGLTQGDAGRFLPRESATRAQAAAMLYRYLDR